MSSPAAWTRFAASVPPPRKTNMSHPAFPTYGVELEYMIVDRETLNIAPVSDQILRRLDPGYEGELPIDGVAWSHELVRHVLEAKTDGPVADLAPLADRFGTAVAAMDERLKEDGYQLIPGGAHPWMMPHLETKLWPHGDQEIYQAFNRIFNCRGHGWSNLQSTHLNLPFTDEASFARLHAAIRLVLPLIPALAASSPILEGEEASHLDMRLEVYRHNCALVPSITGLVVPEPVTSTEAYHHQILEPIYRDLERHDPEGILRHEWVNARGAIARFDRKTIEIRVMDIQECPRADLALIQWIACLVGALVHGPLETEEMLAPETPALARQLEATARDGEEAELDTSFWKEWCRRPLDGTLSASRLLREISNTLGPSGDWVPDFETLLNAGPLARRILSSADGDFSTEMLGFVYGKLGECLVANQFYEV